ncbi:Nephrocystin-3 [Trichoplax sp. H2]|nr:Nephrocystin-3 [Trichoplax sp. H2]|eukprot:RDD45494.1 Nephrocystin-3 [Trichoplax sp. H2]
MAADQFCHRASTIPHQIQSLCAQGQKCLTAYNLKEAQSYYMQAINEIESIPNTFADIDQFLCDLYLNTCHIYTLQYEWTKARELIAKGKYLANKLQDPVRLAEFLYRQGQLKTSQRDLNGALEDSKKSLEMKLKYLGKLDLRIANSYHEIGRIYDFKGQYDKALDMYDESLKIRLSVLGHNHPHIAKSYNNIGVTFEKQSRYDEALSMYSKSLKIRISVHGQNHPDISKSYNNMGVVYEKQGKHDEALSMYEKSLKIRLSALNHNHPHVAQSYNNMGIVYRNQGKLEQALSMYNKSLKIRLSVLGDNHLNVAECYNNMGNVYFDQRNYGEALSMYEKSLNIKLSVLGENHSSVKKMRDTIAIIRWQQSNLQPSTSIAKRAFDGFVRLFWGNGIIKITPPENNNISNNNPHDNSNQQAQDKALQQKKYYNAYIKALDQGQCRNSLIRGMFVGPRNVGKSSIIKLFTQQVLISNQSPTRVAEDSHKMVETESYNIHNLEICDFNQILHNKVTTVIEQLAEVTAENQQNISQQTTDTSIIDQQISMDDLSEENQFEDKPHSPIGIIDDVGALISSKTVQTQSQPVISLHEHYCSSIINQNKNNRDNNQYIKIWDFGGHAIYHVTHHPFMSANSIYILTFNINQDINANVLTRDGQVLKMTYLKAMQEWLTSIIGGHSNQSKIDVNVNDDHAQYSLPIIILVASHSDCIKHEEERHRRFKQFVRELISSIPSYKSHIYSSGIIFNCDPDDNRPSTVEQRQQYCLHLHYVIKTFVQSLPFIRNPVPIRWYIMATILSASLHKHNNQSISRTINLIRTTQVNNIMTVQEIKYLAQEYGLYESDDELRDMLMYLHDLGEVIFCHKVGDSGIVITNVDWLLNIFRAIIQLKDHLDGSLQVRYEYQKASETGKLSRNYIDYAIDKFNLDENSKKSILNLMEAYDIICAIRHEEGNTCSAVEYEYFVPYLLRDDAKPFDLSKYHVSDWLYIGYDSQDIPYIPDGIYYCLLSSCLKQWNNTDVELYYQCAKYYLADDDHYLIVKKEESYIGLQYCFQKINRSIIAKPVIDKVKNSIYHNRPQDVVKNRLMSIVDKRMIRFRGASCRFYIKCSECCKQTSIVDKYKAGDINWIQCQHCRMRFASQSLGDWMVYDEKLWMERWIDANDKADPRNYFHSIASSIGLDWIKLATVLDPAIDVEVIKEQNRDHVYNQAKQLLNLWYKTKQPNASLNELQIALKMINRNDIILEKKRTKLLQRE